MVNENHISALTSIRFFAAFWVVLFHLSNSDSPLQPLLDALPDVVFHVIRTGYAAVGLFFVLSGFILAYTYREDCLDARRFWLARVTRIYPVYLLGLLAIAPFVLAGILWRHASWWELAKGGACLGLLQAWHPGTALSWNGPGWSLSAEVFFYLVFPFVLVPLRRFSRRRLLGGMVLLWCLILLGPLLSILTPVDGLAGMAATDLPPGGTWSDILRFNPLIRLPEFVFGVMLGRLFLLESSRREFAGRHRGRGGRLYWPAMAILAVFCGILSPAIPYPLFHNNALIVVHGLLLYGLAWGGGGLERLLRLPFLVRLGQASYATYIIHLPLRTWMALLDRSTLGLGETQPVLFVFLYLMVLLGCSLLLHQWIEEPARRYLRNRLNRACVPADQAFTVENGASGPAADTRGTAAAA